MPNDEIEDAYKEVSRLGYDEGDFNFTLRPFTLLGTGVLPSAAEMVVEHTVNAKTKTYDAGHGSSWPAEFSDDLRTGVFGPPPAR